MSKVNHSGRRRINKRKRASRAQNQTSPTSSDTSGSEKKIGLKKVKFVDMDGAGTDRSIAEQLQEIQLTLSRIDERGERMEGMIFELQQENDILKKQVASLTKEKESMREEMERARVSLRQTRMQLNQSEQWGRKWNLRIWGIRDDDRAEPVEECIVRVTRFFQEELGLTNFDPSSVDIAHRMGRFDNSTRRPVIVRFVRLMDRTAVLQARHRLRGKKFGIAEDLTATNYRLLNAVREKAGPRNAWTRDGKIFARLRSGGIVRVDENTRLSDYFGDRQEDNSIPRGGQPDGRHRREDNRTLRGGQPDGRRRREDSSREPASATGARQKTRTSSNQGREADPGQKHEDSTVGRRDGSAVAGSVEPSSLQPGSSTTPQVTRPQAMDTTPIPK